MNVGVAVDGATARAVVVVGAVVVVEADVLDEVLDDVTVEVVLLDEVSAGTISMDVNG